MLEDPREEKYNEHNSSAQDKGHKRGGRGKAFANDNRIKGAFLLLDVR